MKESDNNINFKVEVSVEGQQQLLQYSKAFDDLKNSISGISRPIMDLSNNTKILGQNISTLATVTAQANNQNQTLSDSSVKLKDVVKDTSDVFSIFRIVLKDLKAGLVTMEDYMTAGISLLVVMAPKIIEWVTAWIKGKDAIDTAKKSLSEMNGALQSSDYSNAVKQVNELKINVGLAKKGFVDKQAVLKEYNDTLGKTMGQVSNLNDLETKLVKNGGAYLKMTMLKAAAQLALQDAAKKAYEAEQQKLKPDDEALTWWDKVVDFLNHNPGSAGEGAPGMLNAGSIADKERKEKADQRRQEAVTETNKQRDTLLRIAADFQKQAAEIAKKSGFDLFSGQFTNDKPKSNDKPNNNILSTYSVKTLVQISENFNAQLDVQHKNYQTELADLQKQLDNKLITQDEFNEKSQQLQDKYHEGIGASVSDFSKQQLAEAMQLQKDLVEAQQAGHERTMQQDEHEVHKAILPGQKLAAEKKMITDQYDFEIEMAAGNVTRQEELEKQKQQALTDITKQHAQERKDFELQMAQQVSDTAFSLIKNSIKNQSDAKIKGLEADKASELSNKNLTANQRKAIEEKYKKQENAEKVKAFKAEQKASILQAVINGALAITKVESQSGVLGAFVIPGIIAQTAIQIATIAAQKPPAYAKGGRFVSDGRGALLPGYSRSDNTNAYLRSGEAVVVSEAMRDPWARNLVSAINVAYGGRDFSTANNGRGYAIGGIFTDGGNTNRYYNQPVTDAKNLANTLAYQMINNFPPIYVDVKDVNSQQNILAQTVNRVNL